MSASQPLAFLPLGVTQHKPSLSSASTTSAAGSPDLKPRSDSLSSASSASSASDASLASTASSQRRFLRLSPTVEGEGDWCEVLVEEEVEGAAKA